MARAGKPLDPWQLDACRLMMAVREDGKWACTDYAEWVCRQTGKGALLEARALAGLLLFEEDLIAWSSHEYKTCMEGFRRCLALVRALGIVIGPNLIEIEGRDGPFTVKVHNTNGDEAFERLDTGARLKFIARSKGSGRGFTADCQLVDEAFAFSDLHQEALAPTTLAVRDEQTVYMSTPPLTGETAGPMFVLRARADAGGDDSLGYRDWGVGGWLEDLAVTDPHAPGYVDVDDRRLWAAAVPVLGGRITEEKLVALRRKLGRVGFAREVLGIWPTQIKSDDDVINPERWAALACDPDDADSRIESQIGFALDMPWDRTSVTITVAGVRGDGLRQVEVIDSRPGTTWAVPDLAERAARHQPSTILVDGNGPAASLIPELETATADVGVTVRKVNGPEMAQACGGFYDDVMSDGLRHLGDPRLRAALGGATRSDRGDMWRWDRKDSRCDISPLVGVTLARHAAVVYGAAYELANSFW
jgi:hypothetical protein